MTNTIESLTLDLTNLRIKLAGIKAEERDLLKEIAALALDEDGYDVTIHCDRGVEEVGPVDAAESEVTISASSSKDLSATPNDYSKRPTGGKAPDPKSKRQRAFRLIQLGWGNKAIAKRLQISASTAATYRADLANGARVA
jgi:DNA-binding NarL/FixJ family response regulator